VFLLVALLSGCGQQAQAPAPVASGLDATTRAFVELTIATDDQAVKLMDLGASRATDPALRSFAAGLASARRAELVELRAILAPVPYVNHHEGHDMPGMPTEAELVALAASPTFDAEFTRLARAHLTESTTVARSGVGAVRHDRTRTVASAMEQERTTALQTLDTLA
jgi:uncharacterized protein (DUF305 family)